MLLYVPFNSIMLKGHFRLCKSVEHSVQCSFLAIHLKTKALKD